MPSKNNIVFQGHLGKDAEIRTFDNGNKVCQLNIGSSESWKNKSGEKQESTTWMTAKIFGIKAEWAARALKGDLVEVIGKIKTDSYQDKDGNPKYITYIEVSPYGTFINYSEWLRRSTEKQNTGAAPKTTIRATTVQAEPMVSRNIAQEYIEDDLPF